MLVDKDTYLKIINSKPNKEFLDKCKEVSEMFKEQYIFDKDKINKLNLSTGDIKFLKELSNELNTQDSVGQANPKFRVIMDTRKVYDCNQEYRDYDDYDVIHDGEVVDWSKVSVDTKILVRQHNDKEWRRRYFAKYENGKIYAWVNGCTSFTAYDSSYPYTEWEQTKLYKEGVDE